MDHSTDSHSVGPINKPRIVEPKSDRRCSTTPSSSATFRRKRRQLLWMSSFFTCSGTSHGSGSFAVAVRGRSTNPLHHFLQATPPIFEDLANDSRRWRLHRCRQPAFDIFHLAGSARRNTSCPISGEPASQRSATLPASNIAIFIDPNSLLLSLRTSLLNRTPPRQPAPALLVLPPVGRGREPRTFCREPVAPVQTAESPCL